MSSLATSTAVRTWDFSGIVVEHYRYPPGAPGSIAPHAHPDYQLCISPDTPGEYRYRGAYQPVPRQSISILHPDEPHAARDVEPREAPATFWMLFLPPSLIQRISGHASPPYFREAISVDRRLFAQWSALPQCLILAATALECASHLELALHDLLARAQLLRAEKRRVSNRLERARDRIEDDPTTRLSLAELAQETGLSPWRFCREFSARFGHPPHAYQLHARIRLAKRLIAAGATLSDTAVQCGFSDQSHFTRHFRRLVDVTPGRYRAGGKNVQDLFTTHG